MAGVDKKTDASSEVGSDLSHDARASNQCSRKPPTRNISPHELAEVVRKKMSHHFGGAHATKNMGMQEFPIGCNKNV